MSTRAIDALIPDNFPRWKMDRVKVTGMERVVFTARRSGVTYIFHHDDKRWWTVRKMHGGHVLAEYVTTQLPSRVLNALPRTETEKREGRKNRSGPGDSGRPRQDDELAGPVADGRLPAA